MKTLTDDTLDRFTRSKFAAEEAIQGVHCYDILANPDYASAFQYVAADVPNRNLIIQDDDDDDSNDIIQSDIVKIALNITMLDEDRAQKLSFQKEKATAVFK